MTDYLTRLAAQNQNLKRGIRPRLPMRFEPRNRTGTVQPGGISGNAVADNKKLHQPYTSDQPFPEETGIGSSDKPAGIYQIPGSVTCNRQRNRVAINTGTFRTVSLHPRQPEKKSTEKTDPGNNSVKKKHVTSEIVEAGETGSSSDEMAVQKIFHPVSEKSDNNRHRRPQEKKIKTGKYASPDQDPEHYPEETENTRTTGTRVSPRDRGRLSGVPGTEHPDLSEVSAGTKKNISSVRSSGQDRDPEYIPVETENTRTTGSHVSPRDRGRLSGVPGTEHPDLSEVSAGTKKNISSVRSSGQDRDPGRSSDDSEKTRLSEKSTRYQNRTPSTGTVRHGSVITPEVIRKYSPLKDTTARNIPVKDTPVQVTIGRIEIHAGPEDNVQKKRRAPPVLSLEDYLSHRSKRGAG